MLFIPYMNAPCDHDVGGRIITYVDDTLIIFTDTIWNSAINILEQYVEYTTKMQGTHSIYYQKNQVLYLYFLQYERLSKQKIIIYGVQGFRTMQFQYGMAGSLVIHFQQQSRTQNYIVKVKKPRLCPAKFLHLLYTNNIFRLLYIFTLCNFVHNSPKQNNNFIGHSYVIRVHDNLYLTRLSLKKKHVPKMVYLENRNNNYH